MQSEGTNIPWQFQWQRPKLVESTKNERDPILDGMITIESKSARLTSEETRTILDMMIQSDGDGNVTSKQFDKSNRENETDMKWEDLESSSDDDNEERLSDISHNIDPDDHCILSVSILASKNSVQFVEYLQQNEVKDIDKNIAADAIYLEVIKDSVQMRDESKSDDFDLTNDVTDRQSHKVLFRKLLRWPSSALTDVLPDTHLVHFQEFVSIQWQSMIRTLTQQNDNEEWQKQQQLQWDKKRLSSRIGVATFSICRQRLKDKMDFDTLDHDDIAEIINRMALGTYNEVNKGAKGVELETAVNAQDVEMGESDLLLCCVTNDGQVMLYSALDLIVNNMEGYKDDITKNFFQQVQEGSGDEFLDFGFERLLFGSDIQARLQKDVLPLSHPKVSIPLSVVTTMKENEDDMADSKQNYQQSRIQKSFFDLSLLDSNIDPTTIQYRTSDNIPTICISSDGYIIVGGKGRKIDAVDEIDDSVNREADMRQNLTGGFVTFISTKYFAETRTIFVPFVPISLSPLSWNRMKLIVLMGDTKNKCWAIRTDATTFVACHNEGVPHLSTHTCHGQQPKLVKKFSIIGLRFPDVSATNNHYTVRHPLSIATVASNPGVVSYFSDESSIHLNLHQLANLRRIEPVALHASRGLGITMKQHLAIECTLESHHSVQIPVSDIVKKQEKESLPHSNQNVDVMSCLSGEGWSLLGVKYLESVHLYFIVWYGAIDHSFWHPLGVVHSPDLRHQHNSIFSLISEIPMFSSMQKANPTKAVTLREKDTNEDCIGHLIETVMCFIEHPRENKNSLQTSNMLLQNGSPSWKILSGNHSMVGFQNLAATISFCNMGYFLTLRKNVAGGENSSFYEILTWLHQKKDYFTAVHIALNLLGDTESIQDLTGLSKSYSTNLLDGIQPLQSIESSLGCHTEYLFERMRESELASLSNITVVNFNQGGAEMSHAFDGYLKRNNFYNPFEACMVLSASVVQVVGKIVRLNDRASSNLAQYSFNPLVSETHTLWPIQCLLRVGIRKGILPTAILLLNATIPNEMRNCSSASSSTSLDLCKSIVSMIVASSTKSAGLLMNLVYPSDSTYWGSISDSTRFELSLTKVCGAFPLLLETEVRDWMLEILHSETGLVKKDHKESVPSRWLQQLCIACLLNAGCNLVHEFDSLEDGDDNIEETIEILHQIFVAEQDALKIFSSAQRRVDFDLLIPSLLLLVHRNEHWYNDDVVIPTQSLLNCACSIATMVSDHEIGFAVDVEPIMKQCAVMENLDAAAHLIGGNDGIILLCANIIITGNTAKVGQAEEYLIGKLSHQILKDSIKYSFETDSNEKEFYPTHGHKKILRCLQKNVLKAKRFGYFVPKSQSTRTEIDATFAARVCLRAWLFISEKNLPSSGVWLEEWLQSQLQNECNVLACAVLTKCLLWPDCQPNKTSNYPLLGESLGFSSKFLVRISRDSSSRGLLNLVC